MATVWPANPPIFIIWSFRKKFTNPWLRSSNNPESMARIIAIPNKNGFYHQGRKWKWIMGRQFKMFVTVLVMEVGGPQEQRTGVVSELTFTESMVCSSLSH